jgi:hypothetical protein
MGMPSWGAGGGRSSPRHESVMGLMQHGKGRVAVYGDSNCLDSSHQRTNCYDLLIKLLQFATEARAGWMHGWMGYFSMLRSPSVCTAPPPAPRA